MVRKVGLKNILLYFEKYQNSWVFDVGCQMFYI